MDSVPPEITERVFAGLARPTDALALASTNTYHRHVSERIIRISVRILSRSRLWQLVAAIDRSRYLARIIHTLEVRHGRHGTPSDWPAVQGISTMITYAVSNLTALKNIGISEQDVVMSDLVDAVVEGGSVRTVYVIPPHFDTFGPSGRQSEDAFLSAPQLHRLLRHHPPLRDVRVVGLRRAHHAQELAPVSCGVRRLDLNGARFGDMDLAWIISSCRNTLRDLSLGGRTLRWDTLSVDALRNAV